MEYGDPDVHPSYGAMWFQDPPRHTHLPALTDDTFHLADLAQPLPALVICEILGLDLAEGMRFLGWLQEEHRLLTLGDFTGKPEMMAALTELLRDRRVNRRAGVIDDLHSAYGSGYLVDVRPLSERDLLGYVYMLLSVSFGATTTAIGNYLLAIVEHDLWQQLRDEPGLIPGAVEESLRWNTPMPALRTRAKVAVTVGGQRIPAGQHVTGWTSAANRDPGEFDQPARFDVPPTT
jgi:cytochrome P450